MAKQEKIRISKRGVITGTAAAAVLLAVNIGVGTFLYSQHKALDTASNETAEVSEFDLQVKEEPLQTTTAAAEQTVTETTATTAKEKKEKSVTTKKDTNETKTTTAAKKDGKQAAVTTAAKNNGNQTAATTAAKNNGNQTAATTAAPKVTTAAPKTTTAKRTTTTAKHTTTTAKQTTAAPTTTTAVQKPPVTDRLIYNLVPGGKTGWTPAYENDLANNVYRAQPGEELWIDMVVKNDSGTQSCSFEFDVPTVQLLEIATGNAYDYDSAALYNPPSAAMSNRFLYDSGDNSCAADNSVVCSLHVVVPSEPGRYTVTLKSPVAGNFWPNAVYKRNEEYFDVRQQFTVYGLDILVGNTPMPGQAVPLSSEEIYAQTDAIIDGVGKNNHLKGNFSAEDLQFISNYDDLAEAGDKMTIGVEHVTAHAGDKHVPVHVYVKNNGGVISLGLRLIHSSGISAELNGRKPLFTLDPAYADGLSSSSENPIEKIWGFSLIGGENITSDGTVLTFYVDIPDTASTGDVFKIYTRLEDLATGRLMDCDSICTVNGFIRIVD